MCLEEVSLNLLIHLQVGVLFYHDHTFIDIFYNDVLDLNLDLMPHQQHKERSFMASAVSNKSATTLSAASGQRGYNICIMMDSCRNVA